MALTVVSWLWQQPGYRRAFSCRQVNTLRRMVARHYAAPHRFVCVTDSPRGLDPEIEIVPLWRDHATMVNAWRAKGPSCYRRLKMFSREIAEVFGPRFVSIDLDVVVTGDLRPVFDRQEDFVIWGDTAKGTPYNGGLVLMSAGARPQVWETFDPVGSPRLGRMLGYVGSDQAWIGACLGPDETKFTAADGVYSFRNQVRARGLPRDARLVFFHGQFDPWSPAVQAQHHWIGEHYR